MTNDQQNKYAKWVMGVFAILTGHFLSTFFAVLFAGIILLLIVRYYIHESIREGMEKMMDSPETKERK